MRFRAVPILSILLPILLPNLLAGCQSGGFVQPEVARASAESNASVEAVDSAGYRAGIGQVWGSRGAKLFGGADETHTRVTLMPGAYELLVKCDSPQGHSRQRIALRLAAGQKMTVHCEANEGSAAKVVARTLPEPAAGRNAR